MPAIGVDLNPAASIPVVYSADQVVCGVDRGKITIIDYSGTTLPLGNFAEVSEILAVNPFSSISKQPWRLHFRREKENNEL